jgi:hypothetical protein
MDNFSNAKGSAVAFSLDRLREDFNHMTPQVHNSKFRKKRVALSASVRSVTEKSSEEESET